MRTTTLSLLLAAALAGCGGSSTPAVRPPATTGFVALTTVGSTVKLYMPLPPDAVTGHARIAVIDAGAPSGASAVLKTIDLGVADEVWTIGADGNDVVAGGRFTATVYFVDATADTLRASVALPAGTVIGGKPENPTFTDGAAVDAVARRAYVSIASGLVQYDLDSHAVLKTFGVPEPENFALDRATGRLYAPFYLCDPSSPDACLAYDPTQPGTPALTDSLTVIDVASSQAWSMVDPASATPHSPLGLESDALALDLPLSLAVLAIEDPPAVHLLDLGAATYDNAAGTCRMAGPAVEMAGDLYTAIAIDATTHLLVVAREHSSEITFVDLVKAKSGVVSRLDTIMPDRPDAVPWINRGDPHGITIGMVSGTPHVFVASDDPAFVGRIDLAGVARVMAGAGAFADQVSYLTTAVP